jgi:hypothetical protein
MENLEQTLKLKSILKIPSKTNLFYDLVQKEIDQQPSANVRILLQVLLFHQKKPFCNFFPYLQKYGDFYTHYNNKFFTETVQIELMDVFCRIQKHYLALSRFAYIWKIKHATPANTMDLFMNDIDPKKSYILTIYQSRKLFYFTVKDFLNIVQRDLCHSYNDFSVASLSPRNPYSKEVFQTRHYYNAYFQMRYKMRISIPEVFEHWIRVGFSLKLINRKYMTVLQRYAIKNFIWNVDHTHALYIRDIRSMFHEYTVSRRHIHIDEDFPDDVLVEKTRGFMYMFYLLKFAGLDESLYDYYDAVLIGGLRDLIKYNPAFGRKQISVSRENTKNKFGGEDEKKVSIVYVFNSDVLPFETRHL